MKKILLLVLLLSVVTCDDKIVGAYSASDLTCIAELLAMAPNAAT